MVISPDTLSGITTDRLAHWARTLVQVTVFNTISDDHPCASISDHANLGGRGGRSASGAGRQARDAHQYDPDNEGENNWQ